MNVKISKKPKRRIYNLLLIMLLSAILITPTNAAGTENVKLIPGGMPFGVKIYCEGILVVGIGEVSCQGAAVSPAGDAGIMEKDIISAVNGVKIHDAVELTEVVGNSGGEPMEFTVKRGEQELNVTVTPVISEEDGKYKTGMWIRDNTAGIGTVTYIAKEKSRFAGLGHGICDADTGKLLPLYRGTVVNVGINGVIKGEAGAPGELKGYFSSGKIGNLTGNGECGVYGILTEYPAGVENSKWAETPLEAASSNEIIEGDAEILCTIDDSGVKSYKVKISDIDHSGKHVKNFVVTVTDDALLEVTGGIVQGMSGSPVLQNGKIVGAVTHVLVNDPAKGYGIFIENMLKAAS